MTHYIVISSTLSAGAREALADLLSMTSSKHDLLDLEQGTWTLDDAEAAARELAAAGYGHLTTDGDLMWDIVPQVATQLPSDDLDELVPALAEVDRIVAEADAQRGTDNPDPDNRLHTPFPILMQLQNVLRLATYAQQGRLTAADINSHLPAVATMLARAVQQQVRS